MIDTHAHIDDEQYAPELETFIQRQKNAGVEAILVPGVNLSSLLTVPAVCDLFPGYCYPAIGLHPEEVKGTDEQIQSVLQQLRDALSTRPWIAIGEIGLDYHFDITYKEQQQFVFRTQLDWAIERDLPVMIHSRDATEDCLRILKEYTPKGLRGVMHCFSGSAEVAKIITGMGLYLGIGGVITFKNAKLADNIAAIPLSKILLETDAPYLAPVPYRGQRNESSYMHFVALRLAQVYQTTVEDIKNVTTINAKNLFQL
ncbi:MAG: TatD family hydrolase [Bacteroidales bacterium]|nr:TatD family hydrolase [Bacteroidales bacterium]